MLHYNACLSLVRFQTLGFAIHKICTPYQSINSLPSALKVRSSEICPSQSSWMLSAELPFSSFSDFLQVAWFPFFLRFDRSQELQSDWLFSLLPLCCCSLPEKCKDSSWLTGHSSSISFGNYFCPASKFSNSSSAFLSRASLPSLLEVV